MPRPRKRKKGTPPVEWDAIDFQFFMSAHLLNKPESATEMLRRGWNDLGDVLPPQSAEILRHLDGSESERFSVFFKPALKPKAVSVRLQGSFETLLVQLPQPSSHSSACEAILAAFPSVQGVVCTSVIYVKGAVRIDVTTDEDIANLPQHADLEVIFGSTIALNSGASANSGATGDSSPIGVLDP